MRTEFVLDRDEYLVHVRVRIPARAVEAALAVDGADLGDTVYDAVLTALAVENVDLAPPAKAHVPRRGREAMLVPDVKRKIRLDD